MNFIISPSHPPLPLRSRVCNQTPLLRTNGRMTESIVGGKSDSNPRKEVLLHRRRRLECERFGRKGSKCGMDPVPFAVHFRPFQIVSGFSDSIGAADETRVERSNTNGDDVRVTVVRHRIPFRKGNQMEKSLLAENPNLPARRKCQKQQSMDRSAPREDVLHPKMMPL